MGEKDMEFAAYRTGEWGDDMVNVEGTCTCGELASTAITVSLTVPGLFEAVRRVVVRSVHVDAVAKVLKAERSVDDQAFSATYSTDRLSNRTVVDSAHLFQGQDEGRQSEAGSSWSRRK